MKATRLAAVLAVGAMPALAGCWAPGGNPPEVPALSVSIGGFNGGGCSTSTNTCTYGWNTVVVENLSDTPTTAAPTFSLSGSGAGSVISANSDLRTCDDGPLAAQGEPGDSCVAWLVITAAPGAQLTVTATAGDHVGSTPYAHVPPNSIP